MSRARTLAGAIGSDGALNVADVAGLAAVASSGSASDLSTGTLPIARLPTDLSGKTFSGPLTVETSAGDNDSMLALRKSGKAGFAILPWNNTTYLSHNIKYDNGVWAPYCENNTDTHMLLGFDGGSIKLYTGDTFTNGNANWDYAADLALFDKYGNLAKPGSIVSTRTYWSGYGAGARLATSSTSWQTLAIAGTNNDGLRPAGNANICGFTKRRSDTHLRFNIHVPVYMNSAVDGIGFRALIYIGADDAGRNNGANYNVIGGLSQGSNNAWGALGHTGTTSTNLAGSVVSILTTANTSNASSILAKTGAVYFYFEVANWTNAITTYWGDYSDTYPKQMHWTVEEYIPV